MVGSRFMPGLFFIRDGVDPEFPGSPGIQNYSQTAEPDLRGPFSSSGWLEGRRFLYAFGDDKISSRAVRRLRNR